jgi:hypothetical protein
MRVLDTLATGYMPGRRTILRRRYDFAPVRARAPRIVQEGRRDAPWRIHEIRFFRGSVEWPRQAGWRLSASVNIGDSAGLRQQFRIGVDLGPARRSGRVGGSGAAKAGGHWTAALCACGLRRQPSRRPWARVCVARPPRRSKPAAWRGCCCATVISARTIYGKGRHTGVPSRWGERATSGSGSLMEACNSSALKPDLWYSLADSAGK